MTNGVSNVLIVHETLVGGKDMIIYSFFFQNMEKFFLEQRKKYTNNKRKAKMKKMKASVKNKCQNLP